MLQVWAPLPAHSQWRALYEKLSEGHCPFQHLCKGSQDLQGLLCVVPTDISNPKKLWGYVASQGCPVPEVNLSLLRATWICHGQWMPQDGVLLHSGGCLQKTVQGDGLLGNTTVLNSGGCSSARVTRLQSLIPKSLPDTYEPFPCRNSQVEGHLRGAPTAPDAHLSHLL